jgi:hypothetical protein
MNNQQVTLLDFFSFDSQKVKLKYNELEKIEKFASLMQRMLAEVETGWPVARGEILGRIDNLLQVNIQDILTQAWDKYRTLLKYRDRRNETIIVPLLEHTVKSRHHPAIEILLGDQLLTTIDFSIDLSLVLKGFVVTIRDGRIIAIKTGDCQGKGSVACEGFIILEKETGPFALPGTIDLGTGVPINPLSAGTA